jgi:hypothetical protein
MGPAKTLIENTKLQGPTRERRLFDVDESPTGHNGCLDATIHASEVAITKAPLVLEHAALVS